MSTEKLYVLTRRDLPPAQQAVQSGHAVAELLMSGDRRQWDNGTLVYLGVDAESDLEKWKHKLDRKGIEWTEFREPDIGNQVTAISAVCDGKPFRKLDLLLSPSG